MNRLPFMEPIHVLGGGSIGLLFASAIRMAFPSYPLSMLLRSHHEARLVKQVTTTTVSHNQHKYYMEVCVSRPKQRPRVLRLPALLIGTPSIPPSKAIRNLLVTTKAFDACNAISSIRANLKSESRILLLCNGALAIQDELHDLFPNIPVTLMSTTHGAYREDSDCELYHVTHAGIGKTFVENHEPLAQLLSLSGLHAESNMDLVTLLWLKLAANCTINPMTAILSCHNGELPEQPEFQTLVPAILEEISQVCSSHVNLTPVQLRKFVDQVIQDTLHNKSSMLQDIENGRKTEIQYLNGFIVKKGISLGIPTPVNQEICERIQSLS